MIDGVMYKEVELYNEPCSILRTLPLEMQDLSEMSQMQLAFLCGVLKTFGCRKVLEVGVSAGGTTSVLLNCLSLLYDGDEAELYSVDLSDKWYKDTSKKSGFVGNYTKNILKFNNYRLFTGATIACFIEEIGDGIDLLILDTAHVMPGEVLDFLCCFPFLSERACVILHDVMLNHYEMENNANVTKLLFDAVSGEKYYLNRHLGLNNIAAFQINDDTRTNILDIFSILTNTWGYMPKQHDINDIKKLLAKYYNPKYLSMLDEILYMQKETLFLLQSDEYMEQMFEKIITSYNGHVILYGCGTYGRKLYEGCIKHKITVDAMVISDGENSTLNYDRLGEIPIFHISELPEMYKELLFIPAVGQRTTYNDIINILINHGYKNIWPINTE